MARLGVIAQRKRGLASRGRYRRAIFAIGVLHSVFSTSKGEQITAIYFHAGTVRSCSRERPFGNSPLTLDKVTCVAPMGVGEGRPDLHVASSHGLAANVARSTDVWAGR